jgi:hypothetical protein
LALVRLAYPWTAPKSSKLCQRSTWLPMPHALRILTIIILSSSPPPQILLIVDLSGMASRSTISNTAHSHHRHGRNIHDSAPLYSIRHPVCSRECGKRIYHRCRYACLVGTESVSRMGHAHHCGHGASSLLDRGSNHRIAYRTLTVVVVVRGGQHLRGTEDMVRNCLQDTTITHGVYHPFKLSEGLPLWSELLGAVNEK